MANRRMFSREVVESDAFLDMGVGSRCLYYELGMQADDDGFITPKKVMRMTGATEDDLKVLGAKGFVIPFESGVIVIRHWRENNYLRSDRYRETHFIAEKDQLQVGENNAYNLATAGIPNVNQQSTQDRLGKDRLGKDNILPPPSGGDPAGEVIKLFGGLNPSYEKLFVRTTQREAAQRLLDKYGFEKVRSMVEGAVAAMADPYGPNIITPCQMEDKLGLLVAWKNKQTTGSKKVGMV